MKKPIQMLHTIMVVLTRLLYIRNGIRNSICSPRSPALMSTMTRRRAGWWPAGKPRRYGGIGGSNYSIKINKLKSADLMDYNQIIDLLEIDDIADDISIDRMNIIKMHRNEKNGDTYLIFPVTLSSSFELRIYKQGEKSGTGMLYEKYEFDYEKNEGNLHLFLKDI